MTPEQRVVLDSLPTEAGARLRALTRELEKVEAGGDNSVAANWTFWKALAAEWDRTKAGQAADRKAQEYATSTLPAAAKTSA